jgi:hypothetical protein
MTFLAPVYLYAALGVAAVIAGLHFIVRRQPRSAILPTARFVPDTPATTIATANRPSDVPLMLLRMLIVLAAGAGLARPVLTPSRGAEARVILVDVSRSARDTVSIRDSVRAVYRDGDALVLFDSVARLVSSGVGDTISALRPSERRGNMSAALIAALRAGSSLREGADSLELVIVSSFAREELDAATDTIRGLWRGRARLVKVGAPPANGVDAQHGLAIRATADDPLALTVQMARGRVIGGMGNAVIDRSPTVGQRQSADALIGWPVSDRPGFAVARSRIDTVGGITTGDANVVAAFARRWIYPKDSLRGGDVIARWVDGEPAAIEKPDGTGCVRSVAIPVTPGGDLVIRHEFVRLVASLSRPCAAQTALLAAEPAAVARLQREGGLAPRQAFAPVTDANSSFAPWLFALALAAAVAELFVRGRNRKTRDGVDATHSPAGEARAA